jgi:radical SAM protein with 4Fe4S-binding SPASM domain
VFETQAAGRPALHHSLTGVTLPADAPAAALRDHRFLAGQEAAALEARVFQRADRLKFFFIPTWECSLRCPFCFVLKQLKPVDPEPPTDPGRLEAFLDRYADRYPDARTLHVCYLGGEPLLGLGACRQADDVFRRFAARTGWTLQQTITTNGTVDLTPAHYEFLSHMMQVTVSVDGDQASHDAQRRVYKRELFTVDSGCGSVSPYQKALRSVYGLARNGLADRLTINSSLPDDIFRDPVRLADYTSILVGLGVRPDRINIGTLIPTERKREQTQVYDEYLKCGFVFPRPCCVFQYMSFFTLHGDSLSGNYYDTRSSRLGTLDDPLDVVEGRYREYIRREMPVLNDPTCLSCPVIGYCWGGCAHSEALKRLPSQSCNRELLEVKVRRAADSGTLATFAEDNKGLPEMRAVLTT